MHSDSQGARLQRSPPPQSESPIMGPLPPFLVDRPTHLPPKPPKALEPLKGPQNLSTIFSSPGCHLQTLVRWSTQGVMNSDPLAVVPSCSSASNLKTFMASGCNTNVVHDAERHISPQALLTFQRNQVQISLMRFPQSFAWTARYLQAGRRLNQKRIPPLR